MFNMIKIINFIGNGISLISNYNSKAFENWKTYSNYIYQKYDNCTDARELIKDVKCYFENNGYTWQLLSHIF